MAAIVPPRLLCIAVTKNCKDNATIQTQKEGFFFFFLAEKPPKEVDKLLLHVYVCLQSFEKMLASMHLNNPNSVGRAFELVLPPCQQG